MAAVDLLLRAAGLERSQIEGVVATRGPGSFTGVRVALATASGLALALHIPARGYSSLLAQAARSELGDVLAVQPARRGFVYAQPFIRRGGRPVALSEPEVLPLASLAEASLPVVAPVGLTLPSAARLAPTVRGTAEALLELAATAEAGEDAPLVPLYLEPPPATPPARTVTPWPPSPKAS